MTTLLLPGTFSRLLIGLLLPVFLVLVFMNIMTVLNQPKDAMKFMLVSVFYGYLFMGIPSLIYSVLMEFAVNRQFQDDYWVWAFGAILGTLCGLSFWESSSGVVNIFPILGCLSGGVTAYVLRRHFNQRTDTTTT